MSAYNPNRPQRSIQDEESDIGLTPPSTRKSKNKFKHKEKIENAEDNERFKIPSIPKKKLIIWRISIILLFIIPSCLLYLITCSNPSWRTNWSVVKIHLSSQEWGTISSKGKNIGISYNATLTRRIMDEEEEGLTDGGWLSVNMWGWCLQDISKTETICSTENMLFDLDKLLGEQSISSAPSGDDFNFLLTHGLILHGITMVIAMTAIIPMVLMLYRTIKAKNPTVESGWFEHGILLTGNTLCLITYIIDRSLKTSVQNHLKSHKIVSGQAVTVTGVSCVLLTLTFLLSGLPSFYFHMKRQTQLARFLEDGEDEDEEDENQMQIPVRNTKPKVKRSRTKRYADKLFNMNERSGFERSTQPKKKGSLSRWTSRRGRKGRRRKDERSGDHSERDRRGRRQKDGRRRYR